jgi:hypothetical protein
VALLTRYHYGDADLGIDAAEIRKGSKGIEDSQVWIENSPECKKSYYVIYWTLCMA